MCIYFILMHHIYNYNMVIAFALHFAIKHQATNYFWKGNAERHLKIEMVCIVRIFVLKCCSNPFLRNTAPLIFSEQGFASLFSEDSKFPTYSLFRKKKIFASAKADGCYLLSGFSAKQQEQLQTKDFCHQQRHLFHGWQHFLKRAGRREDALDRSRKRESAASANPFPLNSKAYIAMYYLAIFSTVMFSIKTWDESHEHIQTSRILALLTYLIECEMEINLQKYSTSRWQQWKHPLRN